MSKEINESLQFAIDKTYAIRDTASKMARNCILGAHDAYIELGMVLTELNNIATVINNETLNVSRETVKKPLDNYVPSRHTMRLMHEAYQDSLGSWNGRAKSIASIRQDTNCSLADAVKYFDNWYSKSEVITNQ